MRIAVCNKCSDDVFNFFFFCFWFFTAFPLHWGVWILSLELRCGGERLVRVEIYVHPVINNVIHVMQYILSVSASRQFVVVVVGN